MNGINVWKWLNRRQAPREKIAESELKGAPRIPRTKTYSANTGYVYQYVYKGYRKFAEPEAATDYVFAVSRDRQAVFPAIIRLAVASLADCAEISGREILAAEQYALAKMTLFAAFDRVATMEEWQTPMSATGSEMVAHLRALGRI
jgi:hypothetical protein